MIDSKHSDAKEKLEELRKELVEREKRHFGETEKLIGDGSSLETKEETYAEKRRRIQSENADVDDSEGGSESDSDGGSGDDDSESDDDDSEDESALLAELQKIKQERAEQQRQKELEAKKETALTSNPLLNPSSTKKSWRQATVFRNTQISTEKPKDGDTYVNDALRSDFHKKFLDRYIK